MRRACQRWRGSLIGCMSSDVFGCQYPKPLSRYSRWNISFFFAFFFRDSFQCEWFSPPPSLLGLRRSSPLHSHLPTRLLVTHIWQVAIPLPFFFLHFPVFIRLFLRDYLLSFSGQRMSSPMRQTGVRWRHRAQICSLISSRSWLIWKYFVISWDIRSIWKKLIIWKKYVCLNDDFESKSTFHPFLFLSPTPPFSRTRTTLFILCCHVARWLLHFRFRFFISLHCLRRNIISEAWC